MMLSRTRSSSPYCSSSRSSSAVPDLCHNSANSHIAITGPALASVRYNQYQEKNAMHEAPPSSKLSMDLLFEDYAEAPPTTRMLDYLTDPMPCPRLVRPMVSTSRTAETHFWWDIRTVHPWRDFKLSTINAIVGFQELLHLSIPSPALPEPPVFNKCPQTSAELLRYHANYHATKVNAALKVALGNPQPIMQVRHSSSTDPDTRLGPFFTTTYGKHDARARIVGLVKPYEVWNSGMRNQGPQARIEYLRSLSHLHSLMRKNSCRYGFLMTEIELVCVRLCVCPDGSDGTAVNAGSAPVPVFGALELAPAVQLRTSGPSEMTAALALWYMHMLVKDVPNPEQPGWRVDVGGPAALTRQRCWSGINGW
ncbi:hypothetical protein MRB53_040092 [Persea americana]|nr:hypothetical protein MRB53_040092 [Persea americana]